MVQNPAARKLRRERPFLPVNALSHGLTARTMVLPGESSEEFDELLAAHYAYYEPDGPTETALVREIAAILWRQTRLLGYETGLLQKRMDKFRSAWTRIATMYR